MGVAFTFGIVGIFILIPIVLIGIAITGIAIFIAGLVLRKVHKKAEKRKIYPIVLMISGAVLVVSSSVAFFTPSINPLLPILTTTDIIDVLREPDNSSDSENEEYIPSDEQARRQSVAIIESVQNKDTEGLKTMFCEKAKNELDLDSELKTFMEFIDGNIVSYDEPWGMAGGMSTTPEDGIVKQRLDGHIANIETDKGKRYYIGFNSYNINEEKSELMGLTYLYICDEDVFTSENGYPEHGRIEVEIGMF